MDENKTVETIEHMGSQLKLVLAMLATAVYITAFFPLYPIFGVTAGVLALVPIVVIAWLEGFWAGLVASLILLPLNSALLNLLGFPGWDVLFKHEGGSGVMVWLTLFVTGVVVGRLKDMDRKLKQEFTARSLAKEEITRIAKDWSSTFDAMTDGISIHDLENNILNVNAALTVLLGKKRDDLIGQKCYQFFHERCAVINECPFERTKISKQKESVEIYEPHLNAWLSITTSPLFDEDGKLKRIVHVVRNINEMRGAEDELKKEKEELQSFHDLVVDRELKMIELKKEIEELKKMEGK